jgi:predicted phage-related endonuclease
MLTEKQLERHNACITGSKIGAILGLSPFKSRFMVWAEMTGHAVPEEYSSERMRMGNYAEVMMDEVCRGEWGWTVERGDQDGKEHAEYPFLFGLNDRFKVEGIVRTNVLEYKNIDRMFLKDWDTYGVPAYYEAQCRFYSMLYDLPCILIAVFGGNTVRKWTFERSEKIESYLLKEALAFWETVQNDEAPEPDGSESTATALTLMYPKNNAEILPAGDDVEQLIIQREKFRLIEKRSKDFKDAAGNKIKAQIGDADGLVCDSGAKATWKLTKSGVKFDEKQFAEDNPEQYKKYLVQKPGHRMFLCKPTKETKAALTEQTQKEITA